MNSKQYLDNLSQRVPQKKSGFSITPVTYEPTLKSGNIYLSIPKVANYTTFCQDDELVYDESSNIYYKNHHSYLQKSKIDSHKIVKKSEVELPNRLNSLNWKDPLKNSPFFSLFTTQYDVVFISATGSCLTSVTDYFSDIDLIVWCNNRIPNVEHQADLEILIEGVPVHWSYRDISHFLIDSDDLLYRIPTHTKFFDQKLDDLLYVSPKYSSFVEELLKDNEAKRITYDTVYQKFLEKLDSNNKVLGLFTYQVLECNRSLLPDNIDNTFLYNIKKGVATENDFTTAVDMAKSFVEKYTYDDLKLRILDKNKQIYSKITK